MFTIIGADGKEYGPVPADKLREWIASGRANAQTQCRREGEAAWSTLGSLPEFAASFASTPPPTPTFSPVPAPRAAVVGPDTSQLAGRGTRLLAVILDHLITVGFVLPGLILLGAAGAFSGDRETVATGLAVAGGGLAAVGGLALLVIQIWLLTTRGQTLGKRLMSVKIVKHEDGTNPGFVSAVLLRYVVNGLISAVPGIGNLYALADVLFIFRDDRRCIHDFIAGTSVVKA